MTKTAPKPCDSPSKAETVEIVHSVYQPSKEELEADMRVDATFDEAVCQRRSKSTPLAGVKMHHLMRFSPALAVVPVVHRRDPRCFV